MKKKWYLIILIIFIIIFFYLFYLLPIFTGIKNPVDGYNQEVTRALSKNIDVYGTHCIKESNNWKINFELGHNSYPINRDEKYELYVIFNGNNISDEVVKNYDIDYKNITGTTIGTTIIEPEYSYLFSFINWTSVNWEGNHTLIVVSPSCGPNTCDKINIICP